jgi:hypothetical protein
MWYWDAQDPDILYYPYEQNFYRYNVATGSQEAVFTPGGGRKVRQAHSSDDGTMHSMTLQTGSYGTIGCVAFNETTGVSTIFETLGGFDECQIDRSGRYLLIKENFDGRYGTDNRVIDLATGKEERLLDEQGAAGHSDMGHGYLIGANNWGAKANTQDVIDFRVTPLDGKTVYSNNDWSAQAPAHISHTNAQPDGPQYACGSSANRRNTLHSNEIICFTLGERSQPLVVAPVMTDLDAPGGRDYYGKLPKGVLDVTGEYFLWTSNMGGGRLDLFLVKVDGALLTGEAPEPEPEPCPECPPPITCPAPTLADVLTQKQIGDLERYLRAMRVRNQKEGASMLEIENLAREAKQR